MTPAKLRLAMASMANARTNVGELCRELGIATVPASTDMSPPQANLAPMRRDEFVIRATEFSSSATDATGVERIFRSSLTCQVAKRDAW